jgi:hypothetical protein
MIREAHRGELVELRPAAPSRDIPHRDRDRFLLADQNHEARWFGLLSDEAFRCFG